MNDRATLPDDPSPLNDCAAISDRGGDPLDKRVERLENDVKALKDTSALEERVVDRVTERLRQSSRADKTTGISPGAGTSDQSWFATESRPPRGRYAWLLLDMAADARLIFLMFLDRRYALNWNTLLVFWLFIPLILTSGWWFPLSWLPVVGPYLDKVLDLFLAFCIYKALSRELNRYRQILKDRV